MFLHRINHKEMNTI